MGEGRVSRGKKWFILVVKSVIMLAESNHSILCVLDSKCELSITDLSGHGLAKCIVKAGDLLVYIRYCGVR